MYRDVRSRGRAGFACGPRAGRGIRRGLGVLGLAAVLCWGAPSGAQPAHPDTSYLDELWREARAKHLAQAPMWQRLLHYQQNAIRPGAHSLVDDPAFFLAPEGKYDPEAELRATLAGFFAAPGADATRQPVQCRFVARYHWLKYELRFDPARLPELPCPAYERWRAELPVQGVTLIFPAAFLNNPASMFGHTLLRLDAPQQDERTRLLAQTIGFGAAATDTPGLVYAVKGIFGGYAGRFTMAPYYLKVQEYNDIENRDIWEYRLDFTPEEIDRLLMHLWEIGPVRFDYYFFDENCSYGLLSLLEVARPSLDLTSRFPAWVIPTDTVRVVVQQPGLVGATVFRPSRATLVRYRAARLPETERRLARRLGDEGLPTAGAGLEELPQRVQADTLELAYEYANYRRLVRRDDGVSAREDELLNARSLLPAAAGPLDVPPPAARPDEGHGTARFALAVGSRDGRRFEELRWRPAYHDLLDDERGYVRGAQVQFLDTAVRHYQSGATRLESLSLIDVVSLTPRDDFFEAVSWQFAAGWQRLHLPDGSEPLAFRLHGGPGLAWDRPGPFSGGSLVYGFLDLGAEAGGRLHKGFALGAGPAVAWLADPAPRWRLQLEGQLERYALGAAHTASVLALRQRITLGRNSALRIDLTREREFDETINGVSLGWQLYY